MDVASVYVVYGGLMRRMKLSLVACVSIFVAPSPSFAEFEYSEEGGEITITEVPRFVSGVLEIPSELDGVPVTGIGAFDVFHYKSISIPASVVQFEDHSLQSRILERIDVAESNPAFSSIDGVLYDKAVTTLIRFPSGKAVESFAIPEGVVGVADGAFDDCYQLESLELPSTLLTVSSETVSACDGLYTISVAAGNPAFKSVEGVLFDLDGTSLLRYPPAKPGERYSVPDGVLNITDDAFNGSPLSELILPGSVDQIGESAFVQLSGMARFDVAAGNSSFTAVDGVLYNKAQTVLRAYPRTKGSAIFTVPNGVERIASYAFYGNRRLREVELPDTVTTLGAHSFSAADSLSAITIPDSVVTIENDAFAYCSQLGRVRLSGNLKVISDRLFAGCGFTGIEIPDGVTLIGEGAFLSARELTSITLPDSTEHIGAYAFAGTGLTGISIPAAVTSIDDFAFLNSSLIGVTIPDGVTSLGEGAFSGSSDFRWAILGSGIKTVSKSCFSNCLLMESVKVGSEVIEIGEAAFEYTNLSNITLPDSLKTIGPSAFRHGGSGFTSILIPDGVTSIGDEAFSDCGSLSSVTLPAELTSIGKRAFESCDSLSTIALPANGLSVGDGAFLGCRQLRTVTIPEGLVSLGDQAFFLTGLSEVSLPASLEVIGQGVFLGCMRLKEITVSAESLFYRASDGILFNREQTNLVQYPAARLADRYSVPASVETISMQAFASNQFLTSILIPGNVRSVERAAFQGCSSIRDVEIGEGVESIGDLAFHICVSLEAVSLSSTVTSIGYAAFSQSTKLQRIDVVESNPSYRSVDGVLFDGALSALIQYPASKRDESYSVPSGVTVIEAFAFANSNFLESVILPDSVRSIGNRAFESCVNLANVSLGRGVTTIEEYAFRGCASLVSIIVPESVATIGVSAFNAGNQFARIYFQGDAPEFLHISGFRFSTKAYYTRGAAGWVADRTTIEWEPRIVTDDGKFGVKQGLFGFTISGASGVPFKVEMSTDLETSSWIPVDTVVMGVDGTGRFNDPTPPSAAPSARYYRIIPQ